jgi:outer membrane lipoprotein-sorting protein
LHFAAEGDTNNQRLTLTSLSLMDTTGQLSVISLSNIDITNQPATDLFDFSLPEGVDLDDQR